MEIKRNTGKKWIRALIFIALGGVLGYLYYRLVGCVSGTCAITSNPFRSTIYGAVFGVLLSVIFSKSDKEDKSS